MIAGELAQASESDCNDIRLDQPGGSVDRAKIPILDQGDLGTCYAYATSILWDAWRLTHSDSTENFQASSALEGAIGKRLEDDTDIEYAFRNLISSDVIDGGEPFGLLKYWMRKGGSCPVEQILEPWINSKFKMQEVSLDGGNERKMVLWMALTEAIREFYTQNKGKKNLSNRDLQSDLSKYVEKKLKNELYALLSYLREFLPELKNELETSDTVDWLGNPRELSCSTNPYEVFELTTQFTDLGFPQSSEIKKILIEAEKQQSRNDLFFLHKLMQGDCKQRLSPSSKPVIQEFPGPTEKLIFERAFSSNEESRAKMFKSYLSNHFNAKETVQPLGIVYGIRAVSDQDPDLHVSAVIGRRWNYDLGRCEYLVKNSWGKECSYLEGIYCDCTTPEGKVGFMTIGDRWNTVQSQDADSCPIERRTGNFWINEDRLADYSFKYIQLK